MAEPAVAAPALPVGRIVAEEVTFDDYLQHYAETTTSGYGGT